MARAIILDASRERLSRGSRRRVADDLCATIFDVMPSLLTEALMHRRLSLRSFSPSPSHRAACRSMAALMTSLLTSLAASLAVTVADPAANSPAAASQNRWEQSAERMPAAGGPATDPTPNSGQFSVPAGFRAESLFVLPKDLLGSWVCLATDPKGRLIASDQGDKGLVRITPAPLDGSAQSRIGLKMVGGPIVPSQRADAAKFDANWRANVALARTTAVLVAIHWGVAR